MTPAEAKSRTYREWVEVALDHEKKARWSAAGEAWDAARRQSKTAKQRAEAAGKAAAAGVRAATGHADEPETEPEIPADAPVRALRAVGVEVEEDPRAARAGLRPGDVVTHRRSGSTCQYLGYRAWVYNGRQFTSCSDAANACAADIGAKSRSLNGWVFWGIEKREA